jgi:glycosyltransferase involved in cell wall biosynthesis
LDLEKNVVLFVGALYPLKGPHILLHAIQKIVKRHSDVIFLFLGGGDVKKYKSLAEKLGVQRFVRFYGYVRRNLPLYFKAADIFVLPSLSECFPLVSLEAMACGTPVVASRVGGIPSIVEDGENGLLVPPKNPGKLADAIIYLLENEDVRNSSERMQEKEAESYSWGKIAEMTEKVYELVINKL